MSGAHENQVGAYVEWRVTADPDYDFTWSPLRNSHLGEAETGARKFAGAMARSGSLSNIKLMSRTVTVEPWHEERTL